MRYTELINSENVSGIEEVGSGLVKVVCKEGWELTTFSATAESDIKEFGSAKELFIQVGQDTTLKFIESSEADFYRLKKANAIAYEEEMIEAERSAELGKDYDLTDADGTMNAPIPYVRGEECEAGKWYVDDTYGLIECIASGTPTTDAEMAECFDLPPM